MDTATAANIAEIVASVGVIISLIFVAHEFRRNSRNASLDTVARGIDTMVHQFARLVEDPNGADRLRRGLVNFDGLSQVEKGQVSTIIHEIMLSYDFLRRAHESGLMLARDYREWRALWLSLMRTTGGRQWWASWKDIMPAEVIAHVDAVLDDPNIDAKLLNEAVPALFAIDGGTPAQRDLR
jgi:hypothetical protein